MPTYDYQCRSCGHTIELIHSMAEDGPSACERCGGELRRVLFPAGIIFKGSGFYKTDSRASSSSTSSAAAAAGASSSESGSSSTVKPATGADSKTPAGGGVESSGGASATSVPDSAKKD
ncbi:MAG: FmdB family zinc ribbon protein [Chloroflexota bacterium]